MPTHPWIPNSEPRIKAEMLAAIGAADIEELYAEYPNRCACVGPSICPSR